MYQPPLKIGLTGGIASGKSTAAKYFAALGALIIDCDVITRELTKPKKRAYQKIICRYGKTILKTNREIDRTKLRQIIFADPKERVWLENLLHPLVFNAIVLAIKKIRKPYVILVIPLLFETKVSAFKKLVDRILVVDAPQTAQIQRLLKRDHLSLTLARSILSSQLNRKTRLQKAHDVITNNKTLAFLKKQVMVLHSKYCAS